MSATEALVEALRAAVSDPSRVTTGDSERRLHSEDLTYHAGRDPDVVVYAVDTQEVSRVLSVADEHEVAVTPFGAGTSLEGHVIPLQRGISLDLTRMNDIISLWPSDMTARVQAGVTRLQLTRAAAEHGLFFPVDPGADATLGGMAATNASGTTAVRYGKMRPQVLALEAVLPGGRVIRTGTRALKSSAGYDLTGLLVGSEGTLAVITELTLRLQPIPEATTLTRVSFADIETAGEAISSVVSAGLAVSRMEVLDEWMVRAVNNFADAGLPEDPTLLIELSGSRAAVDADLADLSELLAAHAPTGRVTETDPTAQTRLWRIRHDIYFAEKAVSPGRENRSTDVCVPVSEMAGALRASRELIDQHGLQAGIVGHAGDGNIHVAILTDTDDEDEMARARALTDALVDDALARGGTCTGEHGVGLGKIDALEREHGDLIGLMQAVKRVFDPKWLLDPGKVIAKPHD
jgi:D-lactate dehydrogenase (cytochrome)